MQYSFWLLSTILSLIYTCGGNKTLSGPVFILEPRLNVEYLNTEGTILDCSAHGDPNPEIKWLRLDKHHKQVEVIELPRLLNEYRNGSLAFSPFRPENYRQDIHATSYVCTASNIHGTITSSPVSVRAGTRQQFQAKVYDEYVIRGNTAVFKCHIPAFQKRNLIVTAWIREDNYIIRQTEPTGSRYEMTLNGNLHIRNVKHSDQLMSYWCQVKNLLTGQTALSKTSGKIHLNEPQGSVPPKITDSIQEIFVMKGQSIRLPCAAQGHPSPSYRWRKDGTTIKENSYRGSLTISETYEPKTAIYTCDVINNIGADKSRTVLTVRDTLQAHIIPQQQVIDTGKGIKLSCITTGYPVDRITWKQNGKEVKFDNRVRLVSKNQLFIMDARREDRGMYQCFASNKWESVQGSAQLLLGRLKPSFVETFKSVVKQPGLVVELMCTVTGIPRVKVVWSHNGRHIIVGKRVHIKESEIRSMEGSTISRLSVTNMSVADGGLYTCSASNEVGNVSYSNWIHVYGMPTVYTLNNLSIVAGETIRIQCYYSGYPIKLVTWRRIGKSLYMPVGSKAFKNGTLVINNVNKADTGSYECIVRNENNLEAYATANLNVIAKPEVSPLPPPGKLSEGSHFSTMCYVIYGDEPIKIQWLKDGKPIVSDNGIEITKTKMYTVLQIRKLQGLHNGVYTCLAENLAGKVERNVSLKIAYSPKWSHKPKDKISTISSTIELNCEAKGFPTPKMRWFKVQGNEFIEMKTKNRFQVYSNGTLRLTDLQKTDRGKFRCIASNGVLPNLVNEITLEVGASPKFVEKVFVVTVNVSTDVKLKCKVSGNKPITIKWFKDGYPLHTNKIQKIKFSSDESSATESMITIKSAQISSSGQYLCAASNRFGLKNFSTSLEIKDPKSRTTPRYPLFLILPSEVSTESNDARESELKNQSHLHPILEEVILAKGGQSAEAAAVKSKQETNGIFGFNPILVFIIPVATIIIVLVSITITVIILTSRRRQSSVKTDVIPKQEIIMDEVADEQEPRMRPIPTNCYSLDRNYSKLRGPIATPCSNGGAIYSNYEIPDYYAGVRPYATLHLDQRMVEKGNVV